MRNFKVWIGYQLHDWLQQHMRAAVVQIIIATIIELANTLWLGKSVYPANSGPQIMTWISIIYMADAVLIFLYFVLATVSWFYNRYI